MPYDDYRTDQGLTPVISKRAPTSKDKGFELGTMWIDTVLNDVYVLTSVKNNAANWEGTGGGTGSFSALSVNPGNATVTAGNLTVVAGTITASALTAGVVQTSGAGTFGSSKGNDGQILVSSSAGVPAWANITSTGGTCVITDGPNTINIEATGGTSSTFPTDSGTANPVAGATTVAGGTNINTSAAGGTITINLDDSITTVGAVTAGANLSMSAGACTVTSTTNAVKSIYLHANAGTTETIEIYSDQGNSVDSVYIHSDDGGLTLTSGLATADAINITATNAAGGIDVDAGTAGINIAAANGPVSLISGTGNVSIGADSAAHGVTVGSTTGSSTTTLQSGTGGLALTSTALADIDAVGALSLNSSAGVINLGNDVVSQDINIGTNGARTITIGNGTGATSIVIPCGTGALNLGVNGTVHNTAIGSTTGSSQFTAQTGTGPLTLTAGGNLVTTCAGTTTFDAVGAIEINSSGAAISIGNDAVNQNITIAGAGVRTVAVGSESGASQTDIKCGTGGCNIGTSANAHTTTIGSTNSTSATTIQSGSNALNITGNGAVNLDAVGVLELNSSAAAIGIGNDAVAQAINIGTGAAARPITIGNSTTTTAVLINSGTGGVGIGTNAVAQTVTIGNTTGASKVDLRSGSGGVEVHDSDLTFGTAAKGIVFQAGPKIIAGSGAPTGVTAPQGSLYLNVAGSSTSNRLYVNTDGGTTWTNVTTAA